MTESRSQLGKYQLVDKIGEGAMGVVHKAFDPVLNRTLAIKVMSDVIASDTQLRERFLREARAAGSLQHPNVITVFDFGEIADHLFIAMEYVEGYDLAHVVTQRIPLAIEAKLEILIDTLNGLGYAHGHGVVHRDIKPANIRVTADGRAKLMDFGIAHMSQSDLTKSGEMIGTPQYMAPEQVTGDPITPATDIFSLACVGYELFSNTRPFDGETLHAVLFNIVSTDPRPLSEVAPGLPPDLDEVFATALSKDPKQRFESAAAMARALMHVRDEVAPERDTASFTVRSAARGSATLPSTMRRQRTATTHAARQSLRGAGIGAVVVGAVALAIWAPWKPGAAPDAAAPTTAAVPPPVVAPPTQTAPTPSTAPPTAPSTAPPAASPAAPPAAPTARPNASAAADTILASMRAAALATRRGAVAAGATSVELSEGDLELQAADAMAARSRPTDAISRLSAASQRWRAAEQAARDRTVAADARRAEPVSAPLSAPPTAVNPPAQPPAQTPPANVPPAPRLATAAEARAEIDRVITAYEEAIESEDIARIRRAYPGMTAQQQANWEAFFRAARNLRATFTTTSFEPADDRAVVSIDAVYVYDNRSTSRTERNELTLRLTVMRDETGGWRLTSVR